MVEIFNNVPHVKSKAYYNNRHVFFNRIAMVTLLNLANSVWINVYQLVQAVIHPIMQIVQLAKLVDQVPLTVIVQQQTHLC